MQYLLRGRKLLSDEQDEAWMGYLGPQFTGKFYRAVPMWVQLELQLWLMNKNKSRTAQVIVIHWGNKSCKKGVWKEQRPLLENDGRSWSSTRMTDISVGFIRPGVYSLRKYTCLVISSLSVGLVSNRCISGHSWVVFHLYTGSFEDLSLFDCLQYFCLA